MLKCYARVSTTNLRCSLRVSQGGQDSCDLSEYYRVICMIGAAYEVFSLIRSHVMSKLNFYERD